MPGAQEMRVAPGGFAGDPAALAAAGGDPGIEGRGQFERDQRTPGANPHEVTCEKVFGFVRADARLHLDSGAAQRRDAAAVDSRIGISHGDDHPGGAGGDQRLHARRRSAMMGAGFEGRVNRGAFRPAAELLEGGRLGMGAALFPGMRARGDAAALHYDAADRRVRPGAAERPAGQGDRCQHVAAVSRRPRFHSATRRSPRNRAPRGNSGTPRRSVRRRPDPGSPGRP